MSPTPSLTTLLRQPLALCPDNFTPCTRTPWGGQRILTHYKPWLVDHSKPLPTVGESWEFSTDPEAPSQIVGSPYALAETFQKAPELCSGSAQMLPDLMVKIINAHTSLSVQVHPDDDDPFLKPNECGKPESWYILHAEEGSGLYLGFSRPISEDELGSKLREGADLTADLQFVPARAGDFFDIPAGVPHALGAGLTVLEPQRVRFGKSGKTYRLWDWNRTYLNGIPTPVGKGGNPRPLHIEEALRLVRPSDQWGPQFVATLRQHPCSLACNKEVTLERFTTKAYTLDAFKLNAGQTLELRPTSYAAFVPVHGELVVGNDFSQLDCKDATPVFLPHAGGPYTLFARRRCEGFVVSPSLVAWKLP